MVLESLIYWVIHHIYYLCTKPNNSVGMRECLWETQILHWQEIVFKKSLNTKKIYLKRVWNKVNAHLSPYISISRSWGKLTIWRRLYVRMKIRNSILECYKEWWDTLLFIIKFVCQRVWQILVGDDNDGKQISWSTLPTPLVRGWLLFGLFNGLSGVGGIKRWRNLNFLDCFFFWKG